MTRSNILSFIVVAAGIGGALATSVHSSGAFGPTYVTLQPSSPGTQEVGSINVSGMVLAGYVSASGSLTSGGVVSGTNASYGAGVYGQCTGSIGIGVEGHGNNGLAGYGPNPGGIGVAGYGQEGGHFWSDGTGLGLFAEQLSGGTAMWVRSSGIAAVIDGDLRAHKSASIGFAGSPSAKLHVKGNGADAAIFENTGTGRGMHIIAGSDTCIWSETNSGWAGVDGRTGSTSGAGISGGAWSNSGTNYGVFGWTNSAAGYAIWANGRSGASGTKSFRIDDPLDPENKYLLHYSSESPEPQNFYNGIVRTNAKGEAWVTLPNYFGTINRDFRYTLTVIENEDSDGFVLAKVARKIENNRFKIRTNAPNVEVSWEVKAIRNDPWVQRYGAPTIMEKSESERGTYLHPELYGQPVERGTFYRPVPIASKPSSPDPKLDLTPLSVSKRPSR